MCMRVSGWHNCGLSSFAESIDSLGDVIEQIPRQYNRTKHAGELSVGRCRACSTGAPCGELEIASANTRISGRVARRDCMHVPRKLKKPRAWVIVCNSQAFRAVIGKSSIEL